MKDFPATEDSLVLRTDFSDEAAWARIRGEIEAPVGEFQAYVSFVSDPDFDGLSISALTSLAQRAANRSFMFVVDHVCLTDAEHPILVLDLGDGDLEDGDLGDGDLEDGDLEDEDLGDEDLGDEPGRTFRVVPRKMGSVQNNLSIANMGFYEFADSVDADGVFRGFPDT